MLLLYNIVRFGDDSKDEVRKEQKKCSSCYNLNIKQNFTIEYAFIRRKSFHIQSETNTLYLLYNYVSILNVCTTQYMLVLKFC